MVIQDRAGANVAGSLASYSPIYPQQHATAENVNFAGYE